jgi:hypothetical protein
MKDILREIFDGEYDITPKRDKTQQELDEKLCAKWDKVQKMFGDEFIDRLFELEGEKEGWRAFHYYREGFRLGVRLMLEALGV